MSFVSLASTCYPKYKQLIRSTMNVPLATRSLLIKACQAQHEFDPSSTAPLAKLLKAAPTIIYVDHGETKSVEPIDFIARHHLSCQDIIQSAIILDLLRGTPTSNNEMALFREKGWNTEIQLSEKRSYPDIDFFPLFFPYERPIHPDLPYNPTSALYCRNVLRHFKGYYTEKLRTLYPRATHKNMSNDTRRDYEAQIGGNLAILEPNIFGQDDWARIYHETGIKLGGVVEMRQKWYPSGPKPRTYFAMGGIAYAASRFLQDFFTRMVNMFPSTNHITRLQPHRLRLPLDDDDAHYLVYDLSSFTSNMRQQRNFCSALAEFMRGVEVVIVDEYFGPLLVDFGDLLDEYNDVCVNDVHLSYERSPEKMGWSTITDTIHLTASLLGIFGNLMSCTLAHFMIITPSLSDPVYENETAGDDGLSLRTLLNRFVLLNCIAHVGEFAEEKLYMSNDEGAVCLKRPLFEQGRDLYLADNCIPPCLVTVISYLKGEAVDSRYIFYGLDEIDIDIRLSVVGVDLLRFLRSAYRRCDDGQIEAIIEVYKGFTSIAKQLVGEKLFHQLTRITNRSVWPVDPSQYDFFVSNDPFMVYASLHVRSFTFPRTEILDFELDSLATEGDIVQCNSSDRLSLLVRLGYLERETVKVVLFGPDAVDMWYRFFTNRRSFPPNVYEFKCIKDIPLNFMFSDEF